MRTKNFRKAFAVLVTGAVLTAGGVYGYGRVASTSPAAGTANLWVDSNGGTCTRHSTAAAYVDAEACSSMSTGYAAACPGDVVGLQGTLTVKQTIAASAACSKPGTNPVTFRWATDAKISMTACTCIDMDGRSYIVLDGGTNGKIESTANGTSLANHVAGTGVSADPCTNCEIENLEIGPIYQIASGDTFICTGGHCGLDEQSENCIDFSGDNWLIHNNVLHDASWCLKEDTNDQATGDSNTRIYSNEMYNFDHGWDVTGNDPWGHLYFYSNHIHDMSLWDFCASGGNNCHHDGIHCFDGGGMTIADSYIYNNLFDGTVGTSSTSWVYLESNTGSACALGSSTGKWYLFNNNFSATDQVTTNGYVGTRGGGSETKYYMYNNTFDGPGAGKQGGGARTCADPEVDFENNAVGGCDTFNGKGTGTTDYNAYADMPTSGSDVNCWPAMVCNFTNWKASCGCDSHSVYNAASAVGANATGVGTNLTSLCSGELVALCSTRAGVARPSVGAWNAGDG